MRFEDIKMDPELPNTAKRLLARVKSGELTMQDFEKECVYWELEFLNDLKYAPLPTAPDVVMLYCDRKLKDKGYRVDPEFFKEWKIREWFESVDSWRKKNGSNYDFLVFMEKNLEGTDKLRVKQMVGEYEKVNWRSYGRDFLELVASSKRYLADNSELV